MKNETYEKAIFVRPYEGKPTWRGRFKSLAGDWHTVLNPSGLPIAYATKQAARDAASYVGAAWRLHERRTGDAPYMESTS